MTLLRLDGHSIGGGIDFESGDQDYHESHERHIKLSDGEMYSVKLEVNMEHR